MKSPLFKTDCSLDVRDEYIGLLLAEIRAHFREPNPSVSVLDFTDVDFIMAHLEILYGIASHCNQSDFTPAEVEKWSQRILAIFDKQPALEDYQVQWRKEIVHALDRLKVVAHSDY